MLCAAAGWLAAGCGRGCLRDGGGSGALDGRILILVRAALFGLVLVAEQDVQAEEYAAAGYEHIRDVEDRVEGRTVEERG